MTFITQKWIKRDDLRANPDYIYIFGDNEQRVGFGGQAKEMRGEPNAFGIPTLVAPGEFWSDDYFEDNKAVIDESFADLYECILTRQPSIKGIIFPEDGIGTGLARLEDRAPRTYAHLQDRVKARRGAMA